MEKEKNEEIKLEKKSETKKELDLTKYRVDSVINVIPLEPCVVWAAVSEKDNEESSYKSIGIPGFYDTQTKKFISLDGGRVTIDGFGEKLEDYIKQIDSRNQSFQNQQAGNTVQEEV